MTSTLNDLFATQSDLELEEASDQFEERADQLELSTLLANTVLAAEQEGWLKALTATGARLLVGPRGCGKTHLMRYAYSSCLSNPGHPFGIYVSFNRYFQLEPALRRNPGALKSFYVWVIANILAALQTAIQDLIQHEQLPPEVTQAASDERGSGDEELTSLAERLTEIDGESLRAIIGTLEQSKNLSQELDQIASTLTIDRTKLLLDRVCQYFGRRRTVMFLDDAALVLTQEYMAEFFSMFRAFKSSRISPKASVYPGTTEYGDTFSPTHEAESVNVWKSVDDANYLAFMKGIVKARSSQIDNVPEEILDLLAYAAFGVPRSYMVLVRNYSVEIRRQAGSQVQAVFNRVVDAFRNARFDDYQAMAKRLPQLNTIATVGLKLIQNIADNVAKECKNSLDGDTRTIMIGIQENNDLNSPYIRRMLALLAEMGLLYSRVSVSHGDREYARYYPHLALLMKERAFSRRGGFSAKSALDVLRRPDEKHPVRRSISTLLSAQQLVGLKLDLPNCSSCNKPRDEEAKYCKYCGARLAVASAFEKCMSMPLWEVPGLTLWQKSKIRTAQDVPKTIGEFRVISDRQVPLRTIKHMGKIRARSVINAVEAYITDFLY